MKEGANYIVTENPQDANLIRKLLPAAALEKVKIKAGSGYSSLLSMAVALLAGKDNNVVIVADADSMKKTEYNNRYYFIKNYLRRAAPENQFKIFLLRPELESIFFENKEVLEQMTGRKFTDLEIELAKANPKENLYKLLNIERRDFPEIVRKLPSSVFDKLKESRFSVELRSHIMGLNHIP
ncbi:MAG: hypothetical protein AAF502_05285 [Bacteroidota bacterium]